MAWPTSANVANFRYAPWLQTRLDVWKNSTTQSGGNVCLLVVHGGGWVGNTKNNLTLTSDEGYDLANYVLTSGATAQKWSVIAIDYRMSAYTNGIRFSYSAYFPEPWIDVAMAVQAIKENAALYGTTGTGNSWGINPNKIVIFGISSGGNMALVTSFRRSEPHYTSTWVPNRRFAYRSSSIPALVVNYIGGIDLRFDTALGVETFDYTLVGSIFGTSITDGGVEWGLVPPQSKAAASALAYLQAPTMEATPAGVYSLYFTTSADPKPYNSLHPSEQGPILHAALQAKSIPSALEVFAPGSWKTAPTSNQISNRVVQFCEARLAA